MRLRFLVDAGFPRALAGLFRQFGHDAKHVRSMGLSGTSDHMIWEQSLRDNAIIVTKDKDFEQLYHRDKRTKLIIDRSGNQIFSEIIAMYTERMPEIIGAFEAGESLLEIK